MMDLTPQTSLLTLSWTACTTCGLTEGGNMDSVATWTDPGLTAVMMT